MSIITDLYATLNTNAGVRAIVGEATSPQQSRIYPGVAPESAVIPFVTFDLLAGSREHTMTGVDNMERQVIQINCNHSVYESAQTLGDAVFDALEGNGYMQNRDDFYDSITKTHVVVIDWSFLA